MGERREAEARGTVWTEKDAIGIESLRFFPITIVVLNPFHRSVEADGAIAGDGGLQRVPYTSTNRRWRFATASLL